MRASPQGRDWFAAVDTWMLGMESLHVVGLRAMRIATSGPDAMPELCLMVSEKLQAADELRAKLLRDPAQSPMEATRRTIRHYRRKVAANRSRLRR